MFILNKPCYLITVYLFFTLNDIDKFIFLYHQDIVLWMPVYGALNSANQLLFKFT